MGYGIYQCILLRIEVPTRLLSTLIQLPLGTPALQVSFVLDCLSPHLPVADTWFIANFGVHYGNEVEKQLYQNTDLPALAKWYAAKAVPPNLLWRETLPQHFKESADGLFGIWGEHKTCGDLSRLPPGSRQLYNDVGNPVLKAAGIPVLAAWTELAASGARFHKGLVTESGWARTHKVADCTHYDEGKTPLFAPNFLLNAKVLFFLAQALPPAALTG